MTDRERVGSKRRRDTRAHKHFVNLSTVLSPNTAQYLHSLALADAAAAAAGNQDVDAHIMSNVDMARGNAGLKWGPDIRGLLTEEAAQQAEAVATARAALSDSLSGWYSQVSERG